MKDCTWKLFMNLVGSSTLQFCSHSIGHNLFTGPQRRCKWRLGNVVSLCGLEKRKLTTAKLLLPTRKHEFVVLDNNLQESDKNEVLMHLFITKGPAQWSIQRVECGICKNWRTLFPSSWMQRTSREGGATGWKELVVVFLIFTRGYVFSAF